MNYKNNRTIFWIVYLAYVSIYVARVNLSMAGPELISDNVWNTWKYFFFYLCSRQILERWPW